MDKAEAKSLLQACRPNGQDTQSPVFAEALRLVEQDPELRTWWEAQRAFDRKMTAKLKEIPLPPNLRATILAGRKIEQLTPRYRVPTWLAIAAMIALVLVAGISRWAEPAGIPPLASTTLTAAALPAIADDKPALQMMSPDHDKILAWLKEQHAPMGALPASLAAMPSIGCQKLNVQGHMVTLICFKMAGGKIAHLFIMKKKGMTDPPPDNAPLYAQNGTWSTAAWSDNSMSYLLATQAGPDALKQLL